MVQMKVASGIQRKDTPEQLYIPHGSDERKVRIEKLREGYFLYIPHGSDESRR